MSAPKTDVDHLGNSYTTIIGPFPSRTRSARG